MAATAAMLLIAFSRGNAIARPEFYSFAAVAVYGTFGFIYYAYLSDYSHFPFMVDYPPEKIRFGYLLVVLALAGLFFGGKLYARWEPPTIVDRKPAYALAGGLAVLASLAYCVLLMKQVGVFEPGFMHHHYITRRQEIFYLPYGAMFLAGLAVLICHEKRRWSLVFLVCFAIMTGWAFGSRRLTAMAFVGGVICYYYRGFRMSNRMQCVVLGAVVLVAVLFGLLRGNRTIDNLGGRDFIRSGVEFAINNSSVLYYLDHDEHRWGGTVMDILLRLPPSFMTPYEEPQRLNLYFKNEVLAEIGDYENRVTGAGFSSIAEALINFPWYFVPVLFFVYNRGIIVLRGALERAGLYPVVALLGPLGYSLGRGGMQSVIVSAYNYAFFFALVLVAGYVLHKLNDGRQV